MLKSLLKDITSRTSVARKQVSDPLPDAAECEQWQENLLSRMFQLMHQAEQDNFDSDRYRNQSPNAFFYAGHAAYFTFLLKNIQNFFAARQLLADEASRVLYDQLILFRILGHLHVRLPFNTRENRNHGEIVNGWCVGETTDSGQLGNLAIFVTPTSPHSIRVKCWKENVAATFLQRQYYFSRGDITIAPSLGDQVVDAGACFGDTALAFAMTVGEHGRVHSFDPIPKHCAIVRENLAMNPVLAPRISIHEVGLAAIERTGQGTSGSEETINPGATAFDASISTTTIDTLSQNGLLPRVDFIKMDIEGSELDALRGASNVIRENLSASSNLVISPAGGFFRHSLVAWKSQLRLSILSRALQYPSGRDSPVCRGLVRSSTRGQQ